MKKIVLLPLDERPCNAAFPGKLFDGESVHIVTAPCLGDKKVPAEYKALEAFLRQECRDAHGLILSLDMLLYGGLLPSRLHHLEQGTALSRLALVRELKKENPGLCIYGFQCIMRCPAYSSSDEEPDYYETYGQQIHRSGALRHRHDLGLCTDEELAAAMEGLDMDALRDYLDRRAFNLAMNKEALSLVQEGTIDFMVVPQDDSAPYGYTALDQQEVRNAISERHLQTKVLMYPGADEVGLTLLSRMLLKDLGRRPKIYVKYAASKAWSVVPAYEDRILGETVKAHVMAAGFRLTSNDADADLILALSCPGGKMEEASAQPVRNAAYCVERNLTEFVLDIADWIREGKPVILCDNAYANGADLELMDLLDREGLLPKLAGFAGWNTSANSLGTTLAQGAYVLLTGAVQMDFLMLRYAEDGGYCGYVRKAVTDGFLPGVGMDYFNVSQRQGAASQEVLRQLTAFVREKLPSIGEHLEILDVSMPWKRMFETDLTVRWKE